MEHDKQAVCIQIAHIVSDWLVWGLCSTDHLRHFVFNMLDVLSCYSLQTSPVNLYHSKGNSYLGERVGVVCSYGDALKA